MAWFLDTNIVVACLRGKSPAALWIAATPRCVGGTLVTNNTREFLRVAGLALEDWTKP